MTETCRDSEGMGNVDATRHSLIALPERGAKHACATRLAGVGGLRQRI